MEDIVYSSVWVLRLNIEGSDSLAGYFISIPPIEKLKVVVKQSLQLLEGVRFCNFRGLSGSFYSFDLIKDQEKPVQCFATMVKVPYKGQD